MRGRRCLLSVTSLKLCVGRDLSSGSQNMMDESGMGERNQVLEIRTQSEMGRKSCDSIRTVSGYQRLSKKCFKSIGT